MVLLLNCAWSLLSWERKERKSLGDFYRWWINLSFLRVQTHEEISEFIIGIQLSEYLLGNCSSQNILCYFEIWQRCQHLLFAMLFRTFYIFAHKSLFTLDSEFRLPLGERPEVKEGRRVQIHMDCLKKFGKSLCSSTWSCFWQYLVEVEIKWASPRWSWMLFFLSQEDRGIT